MNTTTISFNDITTPQAAFAGGMLGAIIVGAIALGIILLIAGWRIFEKAGEKGWKVIIPIYNMYILFRICGLKDYWFWIFFGVSIFSGVLMSINPPVTGEVVSYTSTSITFVDTSAAIDWSEHVPYLIGTIISAAASIALAITIGVRLAKAFGKGVGFTLGLIFLSGIFYMILGFGKAKYDKKALKA